MFKRLNSRNIRQTDYNIVYLSTLIAILFLFYQYYIIQSIITWTGMCISTFWLAGDNPLSTLYSLFFFIVSLLFIWVVAYLFFKYYKKIPLTLDQRIFYPICLLALSGWMYHLIIMMVYFEWEHQLIDYGIFIDIIYFDPVSFLTGEQNYPPDLSLVDKYYTNRPIPGPGCLTSSDEILTMKEWIDLNY